MDIKKVFLRPFKWIASIILIPVKLLLNLVGHVISLIISLILFALLVIFLLMYFQVIPAPEALPFEPFTETIGK